MCAKCQKLIPEGFFKPVSVLFTRPPAQRMISDKRILCKQDEKGGSARIYFAWYFETRTYGRDIVVLLKLFFPFLRPKEGDIRCDLR